MKNTDNNRNLTSEKKHVSHGLGHVKNEKKEFFINKNDVDEFDISTEYFTKDKLESDGEDF